MKSLVNLVTKPIIYIIISYILLSPISPAIQIVNANNRTEVNSQTNTGSEISDPDTNDEITNTQNDTGTEIPHPSPIEFGTHEIEVCFVNLDEKGQVLDKLPRAVEFEFPIYTNPNINKNTGLPDAYVESGSELNDSNTIKFNIDEETGNNEIIWNNSGKNDAYCETHEIEVPLDTERRTYAYGEMTITDPLNDWFDTRYHDGYQEEFTHPKYAENYSPELFELDDDGNHIPNPDKHHGGDHNKRDELSDGHINLYGENDERRIVIVNKIKKRVLPKVIEVCFVTVDNKGNYIDGTKFEQKTKFEIDLYGNIELSNGMPVNSISDLYETIALTSPYENNTSIFSEEANDAHCQEIELLTRKEDIRYSQALVYSDLPFAETEYTDEHTTKAKDLESFFKYSNELYDSISGNETQRIQDSDGHIKILENGKKRRLLVLNQLDHGDLNFDVEYINQEGEIIDYVNYNEGIYGKVTLRDSILKPKAIRFSNDGFNWQPHQSLNLTNNCNDQALTCNFWNGFQIDIEIDPVDIREGLNRLFVEVTDEEGTVYIKSTEFIYDIVAPNPDVTLRIGSSAYDLTNPISTNSLDNYITYKIKDSSDIIASNQIKLSNIEYSGVYEVRFGTSGSSLGTWQDYEDGTLETFAKVWDDSEIFNGELAIFFQTRDRAGNVSKIYVDTILYQKGKYKKPINLQSYDASTCINPENTGGSPFSGASIDDYPRKKIVFNVDSITNKSKNYLFNDWDATFVSPEIINIDHNPDTDNYVFYGIAYPVSQKVDFAVYNHEKTFNCAGGNCDKGYEYYFEVGHLSDTKLKLWKNNWEYLGEITYLDHYGWWAIEIDRSKISAGDNIYVEYLFDASKQFELATEYDSNGNLGHEKVTLSISEAVGEKKKLYSNDFTAPGLCLPPKPPEVAPCDYSDLFGMLDVCESPKETFHDFIRPLIEQDVVNGYSDGNFYQNDLVNREQMAKFIFNAFRIEEYTDCTPFKDVKENSVFYKYITTLKCKGIIGGYSDGTFRPNNYVTRGEATKFIVKGSGIPVIKSCNLPHKDIVNNVFSNEIHTLYCLKIVNGFSTDYFGVDDYLTRGQLSKIIHLSRNVNYSNALGNFLDIEYKPSCYENSADVKIIKYEDGEIHDNNPGKIAVYGNIYSEYEALGGYDTFGKATTYEYSWHGNNLGTINRNESDGITQRFQNGFIFTYPHHVNNLYKENGVYHKDKCGGIQENYDNYNYSFPLDTTQFLPNQIDLFGTKESKEEYSSLLNESLDQTSIDIANGYIRYYLGENTNQKFLDDLWYQQKFYSDIKHCIQFEYQNNCSLAGGAGELYQYDYTIQKLRWSVEDTYEQMDKKPASELLTGMLRSMALYPDEIIYGMLEVLGEEITGTIFAALVAKYGNPYVAGAALIYTVFTAIIDILYVIDNYDLLLHYGQVPQYYVEQLDTESLSLDNLPKITPANERLRSRLAGRGITRAALSYIAIKQSLVSIGRESDLDSIFLNKFTNKNLGVKSLYNPDSLDTIKLNGRTYSTIPKSHLEAHEIEVVEFWFEKRGIPYTAVETLPGQKTFDGFSYPKTGKIPSEWKYLTGNLKTTVDEIRDGGAQLYANDVFSYQGVLYVIIENPVITEEDLLNRIKFKHSLDGKLDYYIFVRLNGEELSPIIVDNL